MITCNFRYTCEKCGKTLASSGSLHNHRLTHKTSNSPNDSSDWFSCPKCPKRFVYRDFQGANPMYSIYTFLNCKVPNETEVEESRNDARGQEAVRVRRLRRGIRAQAVLDCTCQVSNKSMKLEDDQSRNRTWTKSYFSYILLALIHNRYRKDLHLL